MMMMACSECDKEIEGSPWWYDPFAVRTRHGEVLDLEAVAMQSTAPPSPGAAPFHRECLEKRLSA